MIGVPYLALGGVVIALTCSVGGFLTGRQVEATACELAKLEDQKKRDEVQEAARSVAAKEAEAAEAKLEDLRVQAAHLEQEILAYAKDKNRVRRQCFDRTGIRLWNAAAQARPQLPAHREGAVRRDVPDAAGTGSR